tara:strand:- start:561 stop:716 length:156 start_codon:yes stop_codon:yes gene_type:complete
MSMKFNVIVTFASGLTVTFGDVNSSDSAIAAAVARICRLFPEERKIAHQAF